MYSDLWNISKTHALHPQNVNVHFLCNQKIHYPSLKQGFEELLRKKGHYVSVACDFQRGYNVVSGKCGTSSTSNHYSKGQEIHR